MFPKHGSERPKFIIFIFSLVRDYQVMVIHQIRIISQCKISLELPLLDKIWGESKNKDYQFWAFGDLHYLVYYIFVKAIRKKVIIISN